jgi:hypothetical protein
MISRISKIALTATAIAPIGVTYAVSAYIANEHKKALFIICIALIGALICVLIFERARTSVEKMSFQISTVEAADRENTALMLVYLLPLFTSDFNSLNWVVWIPAILIIGLLVGTGYSYHFNPILGLLGWHFYRVSTPEGVTYVLLTKKELRAARENLKVGQLTEYIVVDLDK